MPERKFLLSRYLVGQGVFNVVSGITWITASSHDRLAGVEWLEYVLAWFPWDVGTDTKVGIAWIVSGLIMAVGGFFRHRPRFEAAGFAVGLCFPLVMAMIFAGAWVTSGLTSPQYANAISYLGFTTFFWVYLLPHKNVVSPEVAEVMRSEEVSRDND